MISMPKQSFDTELNFVFEFELSRGGMIEQIKKEFDTIRLCVSSLSKFGAEYNDLFDRVLSVSLRKLLCEERSILLKVCPDFKMPRISGKEMADNDDEEKFHMRYVSFYVDEADNWLPLSDWLAEKIAWIDKTEQDLPYGFDIHTFENIKRQVNSLNKKQKGVLNTFLSYFAEEEIELHGETQKIWKIADPTNQQIIQHIYSILKEIHYYDLTTYAFIKEMADARGAHIDTGMVPMAMVVNKSEIPGFSAIAILALHMMEAACHQIPELSDYLPEPGTIFRKKEAKGTP